MERLTAQEVINKITYFIETSNPMSLVRLGDCECAFLQQKGFKQVCIDRNTRWYSKRPFDFAKIKLKQDLIWPINNSDIIGLEGIIKDPIEEKRNLRKLSENELISAGICLQDKYLTSAWIHSQIGNPETIREMLRGEEEVHLVINAKFANDKKALNKISKVFDTRVSVTRYPSNCSRKQRTAVLQNLRKKRLPKVVLLGTGVIGKMIAPILAKEKESVAIDMGATIDTWFGYTGRHYFADKKYNNYFIAGKKEKK